MKFVGVFSSLLFHNVDSMIEAMFHYYQMGVNKLGMLLAKMNRWFNSTKKEIVTLTHSHTRKFKWMKKSKLENQKRKQKPNENDWINALKVKLTWQAMIQEGSEIRKAICKTVQANYV